MAKKKTSSRSRSNTSTNSKEGLLFNLPFDSVLSNQVNLVSSSNLPESYAKLVVVAKGEKAQISKLVKSLPAWRKSQILANRSEVIGFDGPSGPVTLLLLEHLSEEESEHSGRLEKGQYGQLREAAGQWWDQHKREWENLVLQFIGGEKEVRHGVLIGCGISDYSFKNDERLIKPTLWIESSKKSSLVKELRMSHAVATSVNLARHLVNLPPNQLNPSSYSKEVQRIFSKRKNVKIQIWEIDRLKKEGMGCLIAVGQGAKHLPNLVHIQYRPKGSKRKPLAFVGKGITFDSGGLNLKPSAGMRFMKKDMGGSASIVGLANWVTLMQGSQPCDFYIALAENAVSENSFRPSDIVRSRSGLSVEIDNTDAEGRLALADALDVASTQKEKPKAIIDVATLTGAVKVGLGSDIAGFFSNSDRLAEKIETAWRHKGELVWRMPLYRASLKRLTSPFADLSNSANGFGGAIRAAVFLEKFIGKDVPWAHFDIYAWNEASRGSLSEKGGSGQAVQGLIGLIEKGI